MASKYRIQSDEWPGLVKLAEECNELSHAALKIMGGVDSPEQIAHLEDELGDVQAALEFFRMHNNKRVSSLRVYNRQDVKLTRWILRRKTKRARSACNA